MELTAFSRRGEERRGGRRRGEESRWDGGKVGEVEKCRRRRGKAGRGVEERKRRREMGLEGV